MAAALNPHRPCKLSAGQVAEIRANRYGLTAKRLAEQYGVHIRTIENIRSYWSWRHVA